MWSGRTVGGAYPFDVWIVGVEAAAAAAGRGTGAREVHGDRVECGCPNFCWSFWTWDSSWWSSPAGIRGGVVGWSLSCAERLSQLGAKSLSRNMFLPPLTAKMFGWGRHPCKPLNGHGYRVITNSTLRPTFDSKLTRILPCSAKTMRAMTLSKPCSYSYHSYNARDQTILARVSERPLTTPERKLKKYSKPPSPCPHAQIVTDTIPGHEAAGRVSRCTRKRQPFTPLSPEKQVPNAIPKRPRPIHMVEA